MTTVSDLNNPLIIINGEPIQVAAILSVEAAQQCDDCGEVKELRPYGPEGSVVCFQCAMKDEEGTKRRFGELLGITENSDG